MSTKGVTVGYKRVSSSDQNPARQLEGIQVDRTYTDFVSGKNTDRPQLEEMLRYLRDGDTLVVHSMDRLARNLFDLKKIVKDLTDKKVVVKFQKENLTFTGCENHLAHLMLSVMGAVAEFERELIKERQREGIELAKKKGRYKGRPPSLTQEQIDDAKNLVKNGEKKTEIAKRLNISRETLYTYLRCQKTI